GPYPVQILVVAPDKILVAIMQKHPLGAIVFIHIEMTVLKRKIPGSDDEFRRAAKTADGRKQMGILPADHKSHETAHGQPCNSPVFPVGARSIGKVYMIDQFRKIDRKLTIGLHGAYIIRTQIIFLVLPSVITV